jgi:large subunit ribosomal protein L6
MKLKLIKDSIVIPDGAQVKIENSCVEAKGKYGTVKRKLINKKIKIEIKGKEVIVFVENATKREKTEIYTLSAHIRNMVRGSMEGHKYSLKACSSHFPMNIAVSGNELVVKNFIGEKVPRKLKLPADVKVKVEGEIVRVEGANKEITSQCAASIERLTKRPGFDKRVFQDGIYIFEKDGKKIK